MEITEKRIQVINRFLLKPAQRFIASLRMTKKGFFRFTTARLASE
jgi:hypothetical protein